MRNPPFRDRFERICRLPAFEYPYAPETSNEDVNRKRRRFVPLVNPRVVERTNEDVFAMDLLRGLNKLRNDGTFCDVTLKAGEKTMRVHKVVMAVKSPYFMGMFSGNFSESDQQEISIKEIDGDSLEQLVDYIYTAKLDINSDNVRDLLVTASFLQITSAEELCSQLMEKELNLDNCIEYLSVPRSNSTKDLIDKALKLALSNFQHVFSKNDYLELDFSEMTQLALDAKEKGYPEDLVFSFAMRWINHSRESRMNFMEMLLTLVDPLLISPDVWHSFDIPDTTNAELLPCAAGKNDPEEHILVSRRVGTFRPTSFNIFSQDDPKKTSNLPIYIRYGSYVCNGYYIYHQGGRVPEGELTESYVYHPTKCVWLPFVPLQQARANHNSCVLNGKIYSVGGSDKVKALSSVEFTDLYTGQRGFTDPLPRGKERPGLDLHGNSIYVVGGSDRGKSYKCAHRFDVREGVWQALAASPCGSGATSCAVVGEDIYTTYPFTLQRYDIRANNWIVTSADRYPAQVFALDNKLFGLFQDHIAKYIPEESRWEHQRTLNCKFPELQVSTKLLIPNEDQESFIGRIFEDQMGESI